MTNASILICGAGVVGLTVARDLVAAGYEVELTIIRTSGDANQTALFGSIGPQGVFVREIEQALDRDRGERRF